MGEFKKPGRKLARPKVELRAPQEWIDRLAAIAADAGVSVSELLRQLADRHMAGGKGDAEPDPPAAPPPSVPPKRPRGRPRKRERPGGSG